MTTTYTVEIDANDDGVFSPLVAGDVLGVRWRLGMDTPFAGRSSGSVGGGYAVEPGRAL